VHIRNVDVSFYRAMLCIAVAEKPHDAVEKFDTYWNIQRHRAVLPAIAWHLVMIGSVNFVYFCKSDVSAVQGHPRSLILAPVESTYATDFLLVCHSNIGPILHRFRNIAGFMCSWSLVALDRPCWGQSAHKP